jgi:hypothetical protein
MERLQEGDLPPITNKLVPQWVLNTGPRKEARDGEDCGRKHPAVSSASRCFPLLSAMPAHLAFPEAEAMGTNLDSVQALGLTKTTKRVETFLLQRPTKTCPLDKVLSLGLKLERSLCQQALVAPIWYSCQFWHNQSPKTLRPTNG